MQSSINSGAIELHQETVKDVMNYTISMFNRFLRSNAEIRLEDSFKMYFKVLSLKHVKYPHHRRGPNAVLGCKNNVTIPGTLDFFNGFDDEPKVFENLCLLTSVILGKEKIHATETKNFRKFNLLLSLCDGFKKKTYSTHSKHRRSKKDPTTALQRKNAGHLMLKEINTIIKSCNIPESGPYDAYEICPLLSEFLKCQIHIIEGLQSKNASILSFPSKFTSSLPQIVLFKVNTDHVTFVSNLKMFFRHFNKRICFGCFKTFSPRYRHVCKQICFSCRRPYSSPDTYFFSDPYFEYCDSENETKLLSIPILCKCRSVSTTEKCRAGHINICGNTKGRAGYFCPDCGKFFFSPFSNAEEARLKHSCNPNTKNCKTCRVVLDDNHQCLITKETATSKWPCLAFFSFSYKHLAQCKECYVIRNEFAEKNNLTWKDLLLHEQFETLVCKKHLLKFDKDPEPNLCVIYKEVERGIFKQYVVTEDSLNILTIKNDEYITALYVPDNFSTTKPLVTSEFYKNNVNSFEMSRENVKKFKQKTMIQNFLLLITNPDWQNTTFLSYNANNSINVSILKGILEFDLIPSVIQNGNKVNLISLDFLEIRFLNASSFVAGMLEEWCEMFKLKEKLHYFPEK